jgi:hypothetical protein
MKAELASVGPLTVGNPPAPLLRTKFFIYKVLEGGLEA